MTSRMLDTPAAAIQQGDGCGHICASLAAYPGLPAMDAVQVATAQPPSEPLLGVLRLNETQLCPQNRGVLTLDDVARLRATWPETRFRLHANVRVLPTRYVLDLVNWNSVPAYWQTLATISRALDAPAYTAHAGRRADGTLADVLNATRQAADLFGCPVGVEGHYPTPNDDFLVSTWQEYRMVFDSGVPYVVDLSHLHIVAQQSGRIETNLVQEMLACEHCLEVHLSANDGSRDQHRVLSEPPWWWPLLDGIHPEAVIFSEGMQPRPARNPVPA